MALLRSLLGVLVLAFDRWQRRCVHAFLVALCVYARAQQPTDTGSVTGVVHLADTGNAAAGVTVLLRPPERSGPPPVDLKAGEFVVRVVQGRADLHATVDALGAFAIKNVAPGEYSVLTYAPGYLAPSDYKVQVTAGGEVPVDLRLQRGGVIEGEVRFEDGTPAHTGAQVAQEVAVSVEVRTKDGKFLRWGGAAHTDRSGRYSIDGLPPGSYVVFAALPGGMVQTKTGLQGSGGAIYYASNTIRASHALVTEVRGTESHGQVDITIPRVGLHRIGGRVVTSTGAGVDAGTVRLAPAGESTLLRATQLQADGRFYFDDVIDEEYTVAVEFYGETETLGLTEDQTGVRMRRKKALYENVSQNVRVNGQDPPVVILQTSSAQ